MKRLSLFILPMLWTATPLAAESDAAKRFGAREDIQQISLSPDGKHLAFISPYGPHQSFVYVVPTAGGKPLPIARSTGDPDQFKSCRWSSDTRLVCNIYQILDTDFARSGAGFNRLVAMDADGKNLKSLTAPDSSDATGIIFDGGQVIDWGDGSGTVLMTRNFVSGSPTGTHMAESREGYGVERVDTATLKRTTVESANPYANRYISDGHGVVRIMGTFSESATGYRGKSQHWFYRKPSSRTWEPLGIARDEGYRDIGFTPVAVDSARNVAYGFDSAGKGRSALYQIALDGSMTRTLVLARPDVDVDGLVQIGRSRRVVGASYATEVRQVAFFDSELKRLSAALSRALPNAPLVTFRDATADEGKLLLFAGSDTDPGQFYLYDKATRQLQAVLPSRSALAQVKLATVRPVTYPAADGTIIPAYLTLPPGSDGKNIPAILMPHGGPAARDEWGFDWLPQFFANRGYAVLQPNYRGSTGYGDAWFKDNGFRSWRTAIGDVNDGARWLVKQGIADPARLGIVGWSYGGYAALQTSVLDPRLYKAIVAVAPVTDLEMLRNEAANSYNFPQIDTIIGHGPEVRDGSPARNAAMIQAPVLIFHGDRDQNVGIAESRFMRDRLKGAGKSVELVEFHHLDHQLEDNAARTTLLDRADGFLREKMGLPPMP